MCKLTNIMNKLNDAQPMIVMHGTDEIYNGLAKNLYKVIDAKYFDMEIQTIGAEQNFIVVYFHYDD